jgi:N-hydroxyarylamine O-acetyltransferase
MLTKTEIKAYLLRLGIPDIEPPTLPYLFRLHRAHVERISWQTVDIFAGSPVPIDPEHSVQLLTSGRSGYCFHLNGAFSTLLRSLGFKVNWHRAGVQPQGEAPRVNGFHLALTVIMPNDQQGEEVWIVDAGLGDMPYEPIPLLPGIHRQGAYTYRVTESEVAARGWRLVHDPKAVFIGVDVAPEIIDDIQAFVPKHEHYSRSPESPWINTFLVRHRHESGSNELRGCVWSKREEDRIQKIELQTESEWLDVLADVFGERLVAYDKTDRHALWLKTRKLHEEWKRAQASAQ